MSNAVRKVFPKLCNTCLLKAREELVGIKSSDEINKDIWCENCMPYILEIEPYFHPVSKNIVEDHDKNVKKVKDTNK